MRMKIILQLRITLAVLVFFFLITEARKHVEPRIIGGSQEQKLSSKNPVSIWLRSDLYYSQFEHICSGSLITLWTVLTAAHCLVNDYNLAYSPKYFQVIGAILNRKMQTKYTLKRMVKRVVVHKEFDPEFLDNDIGLLIFIQPVPETHPILQPMAIATETPKPTTKCVTSGWGMTYYVNLEEMCSKPTYDLHIVEVSILQTSSCNGFISYDGDLEPGMLCAGDFRGGRDSCPGDSGGPLLCNGELAGIVPYGRKCGEKLFPGVYTDVAYYKHWIMVNME